MLCQWSWKSDVDDKLYVLSMHLLSNHVQKHMCSFVRQGYFELHSCLIKGDGLLSFHKQPIPWSVVSIRAFKFNHARLHPAIRSHNTCKYNLPDKSKGYETPVLFDGSAPLHSVTSLFIPSSHLKNYDNLAWPWREREMSISHFL